jgi:ppGpp synthetase/RelA/SpoT-type nucleotidyltranferase
MGLIEDFVARYRKEFDFYDQAARLVAQTLEGALQAAGIRAMVTSRAKSVGRLESKCRQREPNRHYTSVQDIHNDIVDLAGVRVALYFPGEREEVDKLVKELLVLLEAPKRFPTGASAYEKRFSGYWATHYRVQLRDSSLSEAQKRYAEARVEIQVASVLMHAWAEVEHDLAYKPLEGRLSLDEYAILDELNGLVMAGEIALERLQRAGEARVAAGGREFANHYDLAAHLLSRTAGTLSGPLGDAALGRVDVLFELLKVLGLATPDRVGPYIDALSTDTETRPVSEQIIDRLLAEDSSRYAVYESVRAPRQAPQPGAPVQEQPAVPDLHEAMGFFLAQWIEVERLFRARVPESEKGRPFVPTGPALRRLGLMENQEDVAEFERIRRLRNHLVHGIEVPHPADLREAGASLQRLSQRLRLPGSGG